VKSTTRIW